jgi:hypothetical protein
MAIHRMDVTIEAKDDETGDGVQPHHPDPLSAAVAVQDTMADLTKHDSRFGWRITRVRPAQAGTAVVSAADLRHVLDRCDQGRWLHGPYAEAAAALRGQLAASRTEQS